jgi:hypothetical protein
MRKEIEVFYCIKEQIMAEVKPSREEAFSLLKEYNKSEGLLKHALAVEGIPVLLCEVAPFSVAELLRRMNRYAA